MLSERYIGYLYDQGWFNAFKAGASVGKNNKPIPWMTYPFIDFIKGRLNKKLKVFEFGSGNSTLFWADKVASVVAIEHDKEWFNLIRNKMPNNVSIFLRTLTVEYEKSFNDKDRFDIIIVDGERRIECLHNSVEYLSEPGVIILDDSERDEYKEGINFVLNSDFRKIDFWGFSPGLFYKKATTIFYRNNNCLGV